MDLYVNPSIFSDVSEKISYKIETDLQKNALGINKMSGKRPFFMIPTHDFFYINDLGKIHRDPFLTLSKFWILG